MSSKFEMTYLVAVTIAIETEMQEFHAQNACEADYERAIPRKLKMGMGMAYESWHPSWTMNIPTALCLN